MNIAAQSDAAALLAAVDIPSFPVADNKRPCCEGGFKSATTDPDELARLFADPRAVLVGMPTGSASGLFVVDIDPKNGGLEWWESNKNRFPPTLIVHTRSGGKHAYFKHAAGLRNSASRIAAGVDIRAEGGYVVRWDLHGFYSNGLPPADCPNDLLIEFMRRQTRETSAPAPAELAPPSAADLLAVLRAMPNPESVTRDDYVSLNLAVQGCLRALDALETLDPADAEDIRFAAAEWSSR